MWDNDDEYWIEEKCWKDNVHNIWYFLYTVCHLVVYGIPWLSLGHINETFKVLHLELVLWGSDHYSKSYTFCSHIEFGIFWIRQVPSLSVGGHFNDLRSNWIKESENRWNVWIRHSKRIAESRLKHMVFSFNCLIISSFAE